MTSPRVGRMLSWGLGAVAVAVVVWARVLSAVPERVEDVFRYRGADAREHVYLGDYDSYFWLRQARNYLRRGTVCDAVVGGECRDHHADAPVGRRMPYDRSLHVAAIVGLHRLVTAFAPAYPLDATAFWVPVLLGALAVAPAFAIGARLAGPMGGLLAAITIGLDPVVLGRTLGSDNDIWNVTLPLLAVWAALWGAAQARRSRQAVGAALAGIVVGLHAAVWSGWVFTLAVLLMGMLLQLVLVLLRSVAGRRRGGTVPRARVVRTVVALAVFAATSGIAVAVVGAGSAWTSLPARLAHLVVPPPEVAGGPSTGDLTIWPPTLETVGELLQPGLDGVGGAVGGNVYFFVGWLGLLALVLPRRRWGWYHFALLTAGNLLYYQLLVGGTHDPGTLVILMMLPLALALVVAGVTGRSLGGRGAAAVPMVIVWLLAALFQALQGLRFLLLLAPPLGIACGVAVGRLYEWLAAAAARRAGSHAGAVRVGLFVLVIAVLVPSLQERVAVARGYRPQMHDAWWDTLTALRDTTPGDAIVDTWWDYGHWVTYVADRRVPADGASLLTHVPYWVGRVLLAPSPTAALGLLRMLNCGSDTTPLPEGRLGAYGKLVAIGWTEPRAQAAVGTVAGLDRAAALAYLTGQGLTPAAADDVLSSTHCMPPPAYLVLSSDLAREARQGWAYLASWDSHRAYALDVAARLPRETGVPDLVRRLGVTDAEAGSLYARAASLRSVVEARKFVAPAVGPLLGWLPCVDASHEGAWVCTVDQVLGGVVIEAFRFVPDAPEQSRLLARSTDPHDGSQAERVIPAAVVVADQHGIHDAAPSAANDPAVGVLVDVPGRRVLIGVPALLRSTFVSLMYLDGRYTDRFEKVDERSGAHGERVVTWRIRDAPG